MKKLLTTVCSFLLIVLSVFGASAADGKMKAGNDDISFRYPDGWYLITEETNLDELPDTMPDKELVLKYFKEKNICLNLIEPEEGMDEIVVRSKASELLFSLAQSSDEQIELIAEEFAESIGADQTETVSKEDLVWIVSENVQGRKKDRYSSEAVTFVNGNKVSVSWLSYHGELTEEDSAAFEDFISSITFAEILPEPYSVDYFLDPERLPMVICTIGGAVLLLIVVIVLVVVLRRKKRKAEDQEGVDDTDAPSDWKDLVESAEIKPETEQEPLEESLDEAPAPEEKRISKEEAYQMVSKEEKKTDHHIDSILNDASIDDILKSIHK